MAGPCQCARSHHEGCYVTDHDHSGVVWFEQAFSSDGGKTWEVNWIATDTRIKE